MDTTVPYYLKTREVSENKAKGKLIPRMGSCVVYGISSRLTCLMNVSAATQIMVGFKALPVAAGEDTGPTDRADSRGIGSKAASPFRCF